MKRNLPSSYFPGAEPRTWLWGGRCRRGLEASQRAGFSPLVNSKKKQLAYFGQFFYQLCLYFFSADLLLSLPLKIRFGNEVAVKMAAAAMFWSHHLTELSWNWTGIFQYFKSNIILQIFYKFHHLKVSTIWQSCLGTEHAFPNIFCPQNLQNWF